jgi:polysaccharide biosynthesis protein PslH
MKILVVSPWYPWPPFNGGSIRILETLRYLSRHHQVTLLATVRRAEEADDGGRLQDVCEHVETSVLSPRAWWVARRLAKGLLDRRPVILSFYHDVQLAQRLQQLTSERHYDIVQIEFSYAAPYVRAVDPRCGAKTVLSMHNVESLRFGREIDLALRADRRFATAWDRVFHGHWEEQALRTFDGIVSVSESERAWVLDRVPEAVVELVPNGVDADHFRPQAPPDPTAPPSIVFTGAMHYPPNVDAALWFCERIWPRLRRRLPNLRFAIVGRDPDPRVVALGRRPGVLVTGVVADVRPYLAGAGCVVVPLRSGGGTRLKILEAMAMARPVVSTAIGAEGLAITPGRDILIADDAERFATHVVDLLGSAERALLLGQAGRRLVEARYRWTQCLEGLDRLYRRLLGRSASASLGGTTIGALRDSSAGGAHSFYCSQIVKSR